MNKVFISLLYILISNVLFSMETTGKLSIIDGKEITVGEAFSAQLVLLPFEKRLLKKEDLEGKSFLGLFYVVEVYDIEVSNNNYDAVIVNMDLIIPREFKSQDLYIWQLGDRNIPVEVPSLNVNNVSLNSKQFNIFEKQNIDFLNKKRIVYGSLLLVAIAALGWALFKLFNKPLKPNIKKKNWRRAFGAVKSHMDLELLYLEKNEILCSDVPASVKYKIESFYSRYGTSQYSPNWKSENIESLIKMAKEISKEISNGV